MSEEALDRSRKTIENARHAADEARQAEPFHRDAGDEAPRERTDTEAEAVTEPGSAPSDDQAP